MDYHTFLVSLDDLSILLQAWPVGVVALHVTGSSLAPVGCCPTKQNGENKWITNGLIFFKS